eukprot:SAG11_NODE_37710_length_255_cov_1.333333_1_plen_29_part_01
MIVSVHTIAGAGGPWAGVLELTWSGEEGW